MIFTATEDNKCKIIKKIVQPLIKYQQLTSSLISNKKSLKGTNIIYYPKYLTDFFYRHHFLFLFSALKTDMF